MMIPAYGLVAQVMLFSEGFDSAEHLATKMVVYDRIDLLHEGKRAELIADLERRTGVSIVRLEIGKVDLLRDTANLKIHFSGDKEPGHFEEQQG